MEQTISTGPASRACPMRNSPGNARTALPAGRCAPPGTGTSATHAWRSTRAPAKRPARPRSRRPRAASSVAATAPRGWRRGTAPARRRARHWCICRQAPVRRTARRRATSGLLARDRLGGGPECQGPEQGRRRIRGGDEARAGDDGRAVEDHRHGGRERMRNEQPGHAVERGDHQRRGEERDEADAESSSARAAPPHGNEERDARRVVEVAGRQPVRPIGVIGLVGIEAEIARDQQPEAERGEQRQPARDVGAAPHVCSRVGIPSAPC